MAINDLAEHAKALADIIVYVWLFLLAIALVMGKHLNQFGFTVRTLPGFWSPSVSDAINRTAPLFDNAETLLLLGGLLLLRGTRDLLIVTLVAIAVDCLNGVLFPKSTRSLDENRILFTYLGFLLFRGYFEAGIVAILMTILVGFLCGRMLWGMVPMNDQACWRAHLLSFVGGVVAARFLDAIVPLLPISNLW